MDRLAGGVGRCVGCTHARDYWFRDGGLVNGLMMAETATTLAVPR